MRQRLASNRLNVALHNLVTALVLGNGDLLLVESKSLLGHLVADELDRVVEDLKSHLDFFYLLLLCRFGAQLLVLNSVLTRQVLVIFKVLVVHLVDDLGKIFLAHDVVYLLRILAAVLRNKLEELLLGEGAQEGGFVVAALRQQCNELCFPFLFIKLIKCFLHRIFEFVEAGVPEILDGVVGSTEEHLGDVGPSQVLLSAEDEDHPLFFNAPVSALDLWVEVVVPALAARFAGSGGKVVGEVSPHHVVVHLCLIVDVLEDH